MKKLLVCAAFVAFSATSANAFSISVTLGADGKDATVCLINDVAVLAQSDEDCAKIDGKATHAIKSVPK
jgi:hypothetical protein